MQILAGLSPRTAVAAVFAGAVLSAAPVPAMAECTPVPVEPGRTVRIQGAAPPEEVVCYELALSSGGVTRIAVTEGRNIMFSIIDVVEATDAYDFEAEAGRYRLDVGQLMRAVGDEPFTVSVTVDTAAAPSQGSVGDMIRQAQRALNGLGYAVGRVDGRIGRRTRAAIAAFQEARDLEVTGRVDADLLAALRSAESAGQVGNGEEKPGQPVAAEPVPARALSEVPGEIRTYAETLGPVETITAFEGDFTGDGMADAITFTSYASGGNAVFVDVSLFENRGGRLVHSRVVDEVRGTEPRDVTIAPGSIRLTTTTLKEGEPRCCPTGKTAWDIKP